MQNTQLDYIPDQNMLPQEVASQGGHAGKRSYFQVFEERNPVFFIVAQIGSHF